MLCDEVDDVSVSHISMHDMLLKGGKIWWRDLLQAESAIIGHLDCPIHPREIVIDADDANGGADQFKISIQRCIGLSNIIANSGISSRNDGPFSFEGI